MKIKDIIYKSTTIAFYIMSVIAIIMILLKLTNHSPTMDQLILTVLGIGAIILIKQQYDIGSMKGEFRTELKHLNQKVDAIGRDLKQHLFKSSQN